MANSQQKRMVSMDFVKVATLSPILDQVMARLPQVRLESLPPDENGNQVTVLITASGRPEELSYFLDEAEETLQDELDSLGLKIALHQNDDDWGTE
ncbi:MAG: hypothetical protein NT009_13210 [Proteobacteria bacterium]|nr:hypothetical protein [Pseudomonadota bacterium]